jgi:hypothetical protein
LLGEYLCRRLLRRWLSHAGLFSAVGVTDVSGSSAGTSSGPSGHACARDQKFLPEGVPLCNESVV